MRQFDKEMGVTKGVGIAVLSFVLLVGFAASAPGATGKTVQYLFVQSAHSVSFW